MSPGPPRRRRARPVADAPVDALLQRREDLVKGWLIALLEQAPLDDTPAILAADLARDGPRVCDAMIRALADDTDLRRLEAGGALELLVSQTGAFAGASGPAETSRAVDALSAVLWAALREELHGADADLVSELTERLALVTELVRAAALRQSRPSEPVQVPEPPARPAGEPAARPANEFIARASGESLARGSSPPPSRPADSTQPVQPLWVGAIEDEIARSEEASTPLSLLLVELGEAGRVAAVEAPPEATATFGRFAQAVRGVLRRQDILACESDVRAWVIARDTGRLGARALAARIVGAVRAAPPWRGAPLNVSVGLAVLGEDGQDRASMIGAAEESCFAAEASGLGLVEPD